MLDAGDLRTEVDAILPLHRVAEAYAGMVKERHGRGKLVISVAARKAVAKNPGES